MAQLTKAGFEALYGASGTTFPDNTTGDIGADDVRAFGRDIADSFLNISDYQASAVDTFFKLDDDFLFNMPDQSGTGAGVTGNWTWGTSGTASALFGDTTGIDATEKAQGVLAMATGTDTNGFAQIGTNPISGLMFGTGTKITASGRVAISNASDGTDRFTVLFGFSDVATSFGTITTTGAYFRYRDDINGGNWQCTVKTADTTTNADSGVAPSAGVFQILTVEVAADSSNVKFYINGTLVATITTNIPTTAYALIEFTLVLKSLGTNQRFVYLDHKSLSLSRTSTR